ncbi:MAG: calcium/sodium antiporter [Thermoleophilia bacterium]|nr:calcium/sodium antiporter [Thermoleophilia bacterium]
MILDLILFIVGVALLAVASEHFVLGASRIALVLRVPPVVVGAVIIGFGTSAPELLVSGLAAAQGSPQLGLGNVLGSNIANALLVAGFAAVMCPLLLSSRTIRREAPIAIGATLLLALLLVLGTGLSRVDGAILLAALVAALVLTLVELRGAGPDDALETEAEEFTRTALASDGMPREWGRTLLGLVGTVGGSQLLVAAATGMARDFGVSEAVIGISVVAVGTSLPEIVTSIQAARRNEGDLVVGNVLGSNMFNSLGVAGTVGVISPVAVGASIWAVLAPLGVAATLLMTVLLVTGGRLRRREGVALLVLYALLVPVLLQA